MKNLSGRKGSPNWYYRESLPEDVKCILMARDGRAPDEKWTSLRTSDRKKAKLELIKVQAKQHQEWDALRNCATSSPEPPSVQQLADAAFELVYAQFVAIHRRKLSHQFAKQADVAVILSERKQALAVSSFLPPESDRLAMEKLAVKIAANRGWSLRDDTIEGISIHAEIVRLVTSAVRLARGVIIDELEGREPQIDREYVFQRLGVPPEKQAGAGKTIVDLFDVFAAVARKRKDTLVTERKLIVHFAGFVGTTRDVASISKSEFRDFRDALKKVPVNWQLRKETRGLPLREVATRWSLSGGVGRDLKTVAREWSGLSNFYSWLVTEGYCDENPTVGLAPKFDKKTGRMPVYTAAKLAAVFSSPLFSGCAGDRHEHLAGDHRVRDWRFWLPLCAIYSGARAGEIAQLLTTDVHEQDGHWVFDFVETDAEEEHDSVKSLKTPSSRRIVPVHDALIELGILDYVARARARGQTRLFSGIEPCQRGMLSTQPSKFWQRYLKRIGQKERGLALHSFRHTFADAVRRVGGSDAILGTILGHAKGTITAHYGTLTEGNLDQRREMVNAVNYSGLKELLLQQLRSCE